MSTLDTDHFSKPTNIVLSNISVQNFNNSNSTLENSTFLKIKEALLINSLGPSINNILYSSAPKAIYNLKLI